VPTLTTEERTTLRPVALTDRGRIIAVLHTLGKRWDAMPAADQEHARELLCELVACYRRPAAARGA
jgi:hypothetical protein